MFGGTFDPPHNGHVSVAQDVADHLSLDRVLWIPAGEPPHKAEDSVSPADVRLAMVRAAALGDPRFEVATLELERTGPSYTADTVQQIASQLPDAELFWIVGADQVRELGSWHEPDRIARHVRFAVMDRDGATATPEGFAGAGAAVVVPVTRVDVSSTDVRARARDGRSIGDLVPGGVREIIESERLYSVP